MFNNLQHTQQGDVLSEDKIAGPTICCFWVSYPFSTLTDSAVNIALRHRTLLLSFNPDGSISMRSA